MSGDSFGITGSNNAFVLCEEVIGSLLFQPCAVCELLLLNSVLVGVGREWFNNPAVVVFDAHNSAFYCSPTPFSPT